MDMINGFFDMLNDMSQTKRIANLRQEVDQLRQSARRTTEADPVKVQLAELRAANGELRLYVATLIRVLIGKGVVSREDLVRLVAETDAADGERDRAYKGDLMP